MSYSHKTIKMLLKIVRKMEKKYDSQYRRTPKDLKALYKDNYILSIWKDEKYNKETGEGWNCFEDFLIDFIEQNLIFE